MFSCIILITFMKIFNMEFNASISIISPVHTQVERQTYTCCRRLATLLLFIEKRSHSDKCYIYAALFQYVHKQTKFQNRISSDTRVAQKFHEFTAIMFVSLTAEYYEIYKVMCDL
jgi:hypothetical protein